MTIRATCRITGAAKNTVTKLLVDLGEACADYQDETCGTCPASASSATKSGRSATPRTRTSRPSTQGEFGYGDVWTWTAIDADTKLVPPGSSASGTPTTRYALHARPGRAARQPRPADHGRPPAPTSRPSRRRFGADIDYAMLIKIYGSRARRTSSATARRCALGDPQTGLGRPGPEPISRLSYVERQNLTMRMGMRRFTRLTNAFSKKVENLAAAVRLHFMHYNFVRVHQTPRNDPRDGRRRCRSRLDHRGNRWPARYSRGQALAAGAGD